MIPHNRPTLNIEEEEAAIRVIRSGWLTQGKEVEAFENEFCKFVGLPEGHAVAVSSGTASLFLSLWVLNAKNKKISFPGYVCSALHHSVAMISGNENLIDIAPNSPNLDLSLLKKSNSDITILPYMYGIPMDISDFENEIIIEDCCQALGAKVNNKHVGLHGTVGIYSFYVTKLMTSGGHGGMFVSSSKSLVDQVKDYREFDDRQDYKKRFNFQMTDIQAAIGRVQLKKLPTFLQRREKIFQRYKKEGLELLDVDPELKHISPVRYRAILKTTKPQIIINSLQSIGVKSIIPTNEYIVSENQSLFPNSFQFTRETVSLPIYPSLTNSDIDIILSGVITK